MPELKKKQSDSTEKVEQQDSTKVDKKKPIKAGSTHTDDTGGIFQKKLLQIRRKILEEWGNS